MKAKRHPPVESIKLELTPYEWRVLGSICEAARRYLKDNPYGSGARQFTGEEVPGMENLIDAILEWGDAE